MTPNDEHTEPHPTNPEVAQVSNPWLSGNVFLSDVGINSESSTALLPAIELRRRLEDLEARSREVDQRLAAVDWIEPHVSELLPPSYRPQNPPHDLPDEDAVLRSQREAHQRLRLERQGFDAAFRLYLSKEAERKVFDAQREHLIEKGEIAQARSDLTVPELERYYTDLFTSAERAAAVVDGWSSSIRPENAELADRFQEVAGTLRTAAGKKDPSGRGGSKSWSDTDVSRLLNLSSISVSQLRRRASATVGSSSFLLLKRGRPPHRWSLVRSRPMPCCGIRSGPGKSSW